MGWKKTIEITENDAKLFLMKKLFQCSRQELEALLEASQSESVYNFRFVDEYDPQNDTDNYREGILDR